MNKKNILYTEKKILRTLTIQSYHICDVKWETDFGMKNMNPDSVFSQWQLTLPEDYSKTICKTLPEETRSLIADIDLRIVPPDHRHIPVNSIMDIIPISAKILGRIGEGLTRTITGAYVVLTGADEAKNPICAFGNSSGMLDEQMCFERAGTPGENDFIICFDVILKEGTGFSRPGPNAAHHACDLFCQEIRNLLKNRSGRDCTEKHIFHDTIRPDGKKVAIVKLVSGQGAMYDTRFLGTEPSAYIGSRSVIDITGAPILLSPNEYRDGAIRAMY